MRDEHRSTSTKPWQRATAKDDPPRDLPATLGAMRAAGYRERGIKDEIRENLKELLRAGTPLFEGIHGYDATVIPQVVDALLARHDFILLGLRGQAKTRILRQLTRFLDPWMPIIAGSEVQESPLAPFTVPGKRAAAALGDELPIEWVHRDSRYQEKLATPDVTIADLIGDIDPLKAARDHLTLGSEEAILYGILPRTNRGIFAINEVPDLQPRIQVGLLNILEERDIQIRGFPVRFPLDILLVFSANPEDYTNRGSIITPLKDRIDSQIVTHYPQDLATAQAITRQEAWVERGDTPLNLPAVIGEMIEEISFQARASEFVDQTSGVSARLAISALELVVSSIERRCLATRDQPFPRILDLEAALPAITGKIELVYEGEQEGAIRVARGLIGGAVKAVFMRRFPDAYESEGASGGGAKSSAGARSSASARSNAGASASKPIPSPYKPILDWFAAKNTLELSDSSPDAAHQAALARVPGLGALVDGAIGKTDPRERILWQELALEGLVQRSLLGREELDGRLVYIDMLGSMMDDFKASR